MLKTGTIVAVIASVLIAAPALAHQPRAVGSSAIPIMIEEPEVSQAFYAELAGEPAEYLIVSDGPFELYVGLSVPDMPGAETDFRFLVRSGDRTVAEYDGRGYDWERFHEEFAGDDYLSGPEFRSRVQAGEYTITVSSPDNRGKYVLATGEKEIFGFGDILYALMVVPDLKAEYFGKPRASFALSIFGAVELAVLLVTGFAAGFVWRKIGKFASRKRKAKAAPYAKNIGLVDRLVRAGLAVILLAVGIWLWKALLIAAAGFVFYEVVAGWCALYAALGKNTCPIS